MKIFNAHVVETRSVDFIVTAKTKQDAVKNVADILNTPDLINTMDTKQSVVFQLSENEDVCDGDCEDCLYEDEDEYLFDELY